MTRFTANRYETEGLTRQIGTAQNGIDPVRPVVLESAMADFLTKRRPPEEIRHKLNLGWRIEGQSVVIYSVRPFWRDECQKIEEPVAKATYKRKTNRWKIYWMRADLKWHSYPPHREAVFFDEFLAVVDEDENSCFWG